LRALQDACDQGSPFTLVLSDIQMPEQDGFSFVATMRENLRLTDQLVILLTSGRQPGDAARCQELRVACELSKPVARSDLLAAIQLVLGSPELRENITLTTPSSLRHPGKEVRILLPEDNPVNRRVAVRMLEKRGYQVVVAGNGHEALAALQRENFDLVLMDVQMPEMGGLEATAAIRKKEESTGVHVPIVAMTASAMQGDQDLCLRAGMDDYIAKPVRARELIEKVQAHCPHPGLGSCKDVPARSSFPAAK
jgi:two-component system, sensor histidine kinase and response regulator